tara:strand:- start:18339 stop:23309 length:4971 start_codon:yes stop_codon:yes gene_type:complete
MARLKTVKLKRKDNSAATRAGLPDWTLLDHLETYFDRTTNEHVVVVKTNSTTTDNIRQDKESAKRIAVEFLLDYYDKKTVFKDLDNEDVGVGDLVDNERFVRIYSGFEGAHLDPRPGSRLKIQVRIRGVFFHAIPENSLQERLELYNQELQNVRGVLFSTDFESDSIDEFFGKFVGMLDKFDRQTELFDVPPNLVFKKDADRIKRFLAELKDFLLFNDFDINDIENPFRIMFNFERASPLRLMNVAVAKKDNTLHPVRKKIIILQRRLESSRLAKYILDINEVNASLNTLNSWFDFADIYIESFDRRATETFNPALKRGRSFLQKANAAKKKMELVQRDAARNGINLDPGVRTSVQIEKQKVDLLRDKLEMDLAVKEDVDFVGDSVVQNLERLLQNIETIGDSYTNIMNKIDLLDMMEEIIQCFSFDIGGLRKFKFKWPSPPRWKFPDLPTFDIMATIPKQITINIEGIIKLALMGLLKEITIKHLECRDYRKFAGQAADYGLVKLRGLLSEEQQGSVSEDIDSKIEPIMTRFVLTTADGVSTYFDEISKRLNPPEILDLVRGTASEFTLNLVKDVDPEIGSLEQIGDFFEYLGTFVEPEILSNLENQASSCSVRDLCEAAIEAKKVLLHNNDGRRASQQEVDEMLAQREKEQLKKLEDLLNLLDQEDIFSDSALPTNPEIKDLIGDLCDPELKDYEPLIPRDPPSVDYLNDKVINTMYDGALMAFNTDVGSFVTSLKGSFREPLSGEIVAAAKSGRRKVRDDGNYEGLTAEEKAAMQLDIDDTGLRRPEIRVAPSLHAAFLSSNSVDGVEEGGRVVYKMNLPVLDSIAASQNRELIEQKRQELERASEQDPDVPGVFALPEAVSEFSTLKYSDEFQWASVEEARANFGNVNHTYTLEISDPRREQSIAMERNEPVEPNVQDAIMNFVVGDFLFTNSQPFQHELFYNIVRSSFIRSFEHRNSMTNELRNDIGNSQGIFATLFRDKVYPQIIINMLRLYLARLASSKFFEVEKLDEVELTTSVGPCPDGFHPRTDLLNLKKVKGDTKEDYNNPGCSGVDGLNPLPDMEAAGVIGAIKLMVRLYMLDVALKSLFALSEFKFEELFRDRLIIDFVIETISQDLKNDLEFGDEFEKEVSRVIALRQERGEQFFDPFEVQIPRPPLNLVTSADKLMFLIKEQALDVFGELYDRLFSQAEKNDILDRDRLFVLLRRPINVARNIPDDIFDEANNARPEDRDFIYRRRSGEFIVEKYIRVEDRPPIIDDGFSDFLANGPDRLGGLNYPSDRDRRKSHTSGIVSNKVLAELLATIKLGGFGSPAGQGDPRAGNFVEGRKFVDYFEPWKYGLRISYALPTTEDNADIIEQIEQIKALKDGHVEDYEKAFFLRNVDGPGDILDVDNYYLIPLCHEEMPIEHFDEFEVKDRDFAELATVIADEQFPIDELKEQLKGNDIYKIMVGYLLAFVTRIPSLVAIYTMKGVSLTEPETDVMFARTKQEIKNLFNTLLSSTKDDWWKQQDPEYQKSGGNIGQAQFQSENLTTSGPSSPLTKMALMTVPILVRGLAEQFDPSYKFMKHLDDAGILPNSATGPTFGALPFALPINIFGPPPFGIGIGPPITPLGLAALTTEPLPGDRKRANDRKKAERRAEGGDVVENCIEEEEE